MTKQEEIREGIKDILERYGVRSLSHKHDDWDFNRDEFAEKLVEYLHSQGVVIKVDKPLGEIGIAFYEESIAKMLKAGYVAVEPLI